ncbi:hypothetical protein C8J57DRAFT_1493383 [Mycena rebaudengoi]|nr:hypothetical protein C8J57DRAFT_1493383 [Mycena rebaudengoi]
MSKQIILDFFASGNNKDTDALSAALADDFTGTILPSSLDVPDLKYTIEVILEAGSAAVVHICHTSLPVLPGSRLF